MGHKEMESASRMLREAEEMLSQHSKLTQGISTRVAGDGYMNILIAGMELTVSKSVIRDFLGDVAKWSHLEARALMEKALEATEAQSG